MKTTTNAQMYADQINYDMHDDHLDKQYMTNSWIDIMNRNAVESVDIEQSGHHSLRFLFGDMSMLTLIIKNQIIADQFAF